MASSLVLLIDFRGLTSCDPALERELSQLLSTLPASLATITVHAKMQNGEIVPVQGRLLKVLTAHTPSGRALRVLLNDPE